MLFTCWILQVVDEVLLTRKFSIFSYSCTFLQPTQKDAEVIAEEDQNFLAKMQNHLSKQTMSPRDAPIRSNNGTPSPVQPRIESRRSTGSNSSYIQVRHIENTIDSN